MDTKTDRTKELAELKPKLKTGEQVTTATLEELSNGKGEDEADG